MRLICPKCDAQYEVADDVIPVNGRDVQCSNCGETWYQLHPQKVADTSAHDDAPDEDEDPAPAPEPARRALDPSVADILRQEAAMEHRARAEAAGALESQPELGLESGERVASNPPPQASDPKPDVTPDAPKNAQVPEPTAAPEIPRPRRELLPDIEEINSSLRSTSDRQTGTTSDTLPVPRPANKSGFGRGFALMVLLAVILMATYNFAPEIAQSVPQVDPYLSAYVAQVDTARSWLDGQVAAVLTWLDTVATSQTSG